MVWMYVLAPRTTPNDMIKYTEGGLVIDEFCQPEISDFDPWRRLQSEEDILIYRLVPVENR